MLCKLSSIKDDSRVMYLSLTVRAPVKPAVLSTERHVGIEVLPLAKHCIISEASRVPYACNWL
jgi:hypothetical protein